MEKPNTNTGAGQGPTAIRKYWYVPVLLILLAVLFLAGSWYGRRNAVDPKTTGGRRILHYVDPMNPAHTSPEPGLAPCGMKMEPVYADDEGQAGGAGLPPGSVRITPEKQQQIGVRVATVEKSPWTYTLRTVGKVAVDETRTYRLNAFIDGWIVRIFDNTTGSLVRRDEPLATFYNKDLPSTLQIFYYALDSLDVYTKDPNLLPRQHDLLLAQKLTSEGVLMNLGMSQLQINELARNREYTQEITIYAPATSFVLARNITPGQRFAVGEELYRLADLGRVWILADLFEKEAKYIRPGEKVKVTLQDQDEPRLATVSEILPEFDPATLTLKVRLEMDNPKFTLRPGMFVDVEFPIKMPPTINVPLDAVMDSGLKQTVFLDRGNGYFEPRRVKTGWRLGDRVQILEGLETGDKLAVSGNFLIDSESRMKLAAAGFFGNVVKDPVCGMNLDEGKARTAGRKSEYHGKTYYFCSDACKQKFEQTPERYLAKPEAVPATAPHRMASPHPVHQAQAAPPAQAAHQAAATPETAKDPVCGMPVAPGTAAQAGRTSEYQGKTYYFDTIGCKQRFDKNPQRYLSGSGAVVLSPVPLRTYPKVPMQADTLLRFNRKLMQGSPQRPEQAGPPAATQAGPQGSSPGVPQSPSPEMPQAMPPGSAHALPSAGAPAMPHGTQMMSPGAGQAKPPATPPAKPHGAQAGPQGPIQAMPGGAAQLDSDTVYEYKLKLLRKIKRGPSEEMRKSALDGQRRKEEYEKRQQEEAQANKGAAQTKPQRSDKPKPRKPAPVKPLKRQTQHKPPQAQPPAPPHSGGHQQ